MNYFARLPEARPTVITRILIFISLAWRLWELLEYNIWARATYPQLGQVIPEQIYRLHPLFSDSQTLIAYYGLILAVAAVWLWRGGISGLLVLILDSFVSSQSLPLGWGPLALHPVLLLCFIWDAGDERLKRFFPLIMGIQITSMYFMSALSKDSLTWLENGNASILALNGEYLATDFGRFLGSILKNFPVAGIIFSWSAPLLQLSVFVLWLTPGKELARKLFNGVLVLLALFHVSMALVLHIKPFSLACLAILSFYYCPDGTRTFAAGRLRFIAFTCVGIWAAGLFLGIVKVPSKFFGVFWLSQSWRIMTVPESPGHFAFTVKNGNLVIRESTNSRYEVALATALKLNMKLRQYFLRSVVCPSMPDGKLVVFHTGRKDQEVYSCSSGGIF